MASSSGILKTDPNFMKSLLVDFNLIDTSKPLLKSLVEEFKQPIELNDYLSKMEQGVLSNEPLREIFFSLQKLPVKTSEAKLGADFQKKYFLHLMVLLEKLTSKMTREKNYQQFFIEVTDHLLQQRSKSNPGNALTNFLNVYRATQDLFIAIKVLSIDGFVWEQRYWNETKGNRTSANAKQFIQRHKLSWPNIENISSDAKATVEELFALRINIFEAFYTQARKNPFNAKAALILIKYLEAKPSLWKRNSQGIEQIQNMTKQWQDLYGSWNAVFVSEEFDSMMHFFLAKLLSPSVLCAVPEEYIFFRVTQLWLTVSLSTILKMHDREQHIAAPEEMKNFLQNAGKVNYRYGLKLLNELGIEYSEKQIENDYQRYTDLFRFPRAASACVGTVFFGKNITSNKPNLGLSAPFGMQPLGLEKRLRSKL